MSVRPSLMNKGYGARAAMEMVSLVKNEYRQRNMTVVSASANPDNPASWKIIEYMGGKFKHESDPYGWGMSRFYEMEMEL